MKIETSESINTDIFGCVRFGGSNSFGNKGRPSMISAKYRLKEERRKVLKISISKLKRIEDPESSLRRSVLINNTMKRLQREAREEKLQRQGIYQPNVAISASSFEREIIKPVVVPIMPAATAVEQIRSATEIPSTPITTPTPPSPTPVLQCRKRTTRGDTPDSDECDVQDVLSHFYMPPTPRLLTSIDDEDDMMPATKRQRIQLPSIKEEEVTVTSNIGDISTPSSIQLPSINERLLEAQNDTTNMMTIQELPSIISSRLQSDDSSNNNIKISPPSNINNNNTSSSSNLNTQLSPILSERLQSEICCESQSSESLDLALSNRSDETDILSPITDINMDVVNDNNLSERLNFTTTAINTTNNNNNTEYSSDDDDEVIDVVNESNTPFDTTDFSTRLSSATDNNILSMEVSDDNSTSISRLRDLCDDSSVRYTNTTTSTLSSLSSHERRSNSPTPSSPPTSSSQLQSNQTSCSAAASPSSSMLESNEQQHFSCGHSSIFGELQSVVFHSLIASLES